MRVSPPIEGACLPLPSDRIHDQVRQVARRAPAALALIAGRNVVTYGQLIDQVDSRADNLERLGVREGSVVAIVDSGTTDVLVPPAHGEWLAANVPGCVVKVDAEAGHLGSDPVRDITENVMWLRDGVPPPGAS